MNEPNGDDNAGIAAESVRTASGSPDFHDQLNNVVGSVEKSWHNLKSRDKDARA